MNGFNASVLAFGLALMASPVLAEGHGQGNEEAHGQGGGMMAEFVSEWDMNDDGMVTVEDLATRRADLFAMFDLNGDNGIDAEEQANMADTIAMQQEVNHGGAHGQGGPGALIHGAMTAEYADTNHDGIISADEWTAATPRLFAQLDRNGDGQLDAQDFRRHD